MKSILPCLIALAISAFGQGFNVPKDSDISITWVTNSVFTYTPASHIDLYGTGEVAGPLRRNGDKNLYWNIDNWGYRKYGGKMMYASMPWVMGLKEDGSCVGFIFDTAACSELNCGEDGSIKFTCKIRENLSSMPIFLSSGSQGSGDCDEVPGEGNTVRFHVAGHTLHGRIQAFHFQ